VQYFVQIPKQVHYLVQIEKYIIILLILEISHIIRRCILGIKKWRGSTSFMEYLLHLVQSDWKSIYSFCHSINFHS